MSKVIAKLKKYKKHDQLLLLLSRSLVNKKEKEYIQELINMPNINWDLFLGEAFNNRLNGVIYNNIKEFKNIPRETMLYLNLAFVAQKERSLIHQQEINKIYNLFEKENLNYVFQKGSVLNSIVYSSGERISTDTDILIYIKDLNKCINLLENLGYVQGEIDNFKDMTIPATKKEKIFARLNTYEVVPLSIKLDNSFLRFHEIDINFKLFKEEKEGTSEKMLQDSTIITDKGNSIRALSLESFLIFLCVHLYREATMVNSIISGRDLSLYKFLDIHFLISKNKKRFCWKKVLDKSTDLDVLDSVYYTLYHTELLYPDTVEEEVLNMLKPESLEYLDEYKGKESTNEVYRWKNDFITRVFDPLRKLEALENIKEESEHFNDIIKKLKE